MNFDIGDGFVEFVFLSAKVCRDSRKYAINKYGKSTEFEESVLFPYLFCLTVLLWR